MIAKIIINAKSRSVDKAFDYLIPKDLEKKIAVGMRVVVPFGKGDKLSEGFVLAIADKSSQKELKKIKEISDPRMLFDSKGIEMIEWMREKYLCTYADAIRLIAPSGSGIRFQEWVCLTDKAKLEPDKISGAVRKKIAELLINEDTAIEINRLMIMMDKNVRPFLLQMQKSGLVRIIQTDSKQVRDKIVRMVRLLEGIDNIADEIKKMQKSSPKQAAMLDILSQNPYIAVPDLISFADASYNSVNALYKKGFIEFFDMVIRRDPMQGRKIKPTVPQRPTTEQKTALEALNAVYKKGEFDTFLIYGVTGSGKTEIYLHIISKVIESGKKAIVLVPEIALTPQMTNRFTSRFGNRTAILHSALSLGERYDEWKRIDDGKVDVVVGARSAVFAPIKNIGAIILDEEHEGTYKSELTPRYHARQVAEFRARQNNAILILASATPAIESMYKAKSGEYKLLELKERYNKNQMPKAKIVDMRQELSAGNRSMISRALKAQIESNIKQKKQTILLLNRRGFSTFVSCRSCGFVAKCEHCNISLTYHRYSDILMCHYCGYSRHNYKVCPACASKYIKYFGAGTQKLEEELKNTFEGVSVIRMDADTTGTKCSHQKILDEFENKNINILIGTQMVAKGLDFKNVTLVGVMAADLSLNIDDYKSAERTFSLITQVCGRAGRGDEPGRAVIQTYTPENSTINFAKNHDYFGFYNEEIMIRKALWYPPFCELIAIQISGHSENMVLSAIRDTSKLIKKRTTEQDFGKVEMLGPAAAMISKIKDRYRYNIMLKCENCDRLNPVLKETIKRFYKNTNSKHLSLVIDKNANNFI